MSRHLLLDFRLTQSLTVSEIETLSKLQRPLLIGDVHTGDVYARGVAMLCVVGAMGGVGRFLAEVLPFVELPGVSSICLRIAGSSMRYIVARGAVEMRMVFPAWAMFSDKVVGLVVLLPSSGIHTLSFRQEETCRI